MRPNPKNIEQLQEQIGLLAGRIQDQEALKMIHEMLLQISIQPSEEILPPEVIAGLELAEVQIAEGNVMRHEDVMARFREKYGE